MSQTPPHRDLPDPAALERVESPAASGTLVTGHFPLVLIPTGAQVSVTAPRTVQSCCRLKNLKKKKTNRELQGG